MKKQNNNKTTIQIINKTPNKQTKKHNCSPHKRLTICGFLWLTICGIIIKKQMMKQNNNKTIIQNINKTRNKLKINKQPSNKQTPNEQTKQ